MKDALQGAAGLGERGAGGHPAHDADPPIAGLAVVVGRTAEAGLVGEGDRDVGDFADLHRAVERGRGDADQDGGDAVDRDGFSDGGRVATETALPVAVRNHGDGLGRRKVVGGGEKAAGGGRDAESEMIAAGSNLTAARDLGGTIDDHVESTGGGESEDGGEGTGLFLKRLEGGEGKRRAGALVGTGLRGAPAAGGLRADVFLGEPVEDDEFLRGPDWQHFEQDGLHQAEDGGVGPDAEGEGEDGDGGEAGGFRELAEGELEIGKHGATENSPGRERLPGNDE
ncbi:MAG: hypothetical protein NTV51_07570 [Verrucomicrobia bacterium]|nr:hypothetical protein [Verrucomicrobiota bacterium]